MTKAEQFRENAEEAMQLSRQSRTENAKKVLTDLALTWKQARRWPTGSLSLRRSLGSDDQRSKPSATFKLSDRHLLAHHWRMGGI
jgi:hypothetical protein